MKNKKQIITIIIVTLALVAILGASYAWLTLTLSGEKTAIIKAGTLDLILDESTSEGINLENSIPMSEKKGMTLDPYTFKLKNTGTLPVKYTIYLDDNVDLAETKMDNNYARLVLEKDKILVLNNLLANLGQDKRVIETGVIDPEESYEYKLRLWIDKTAPNEVGGSVFSGKLRVEAEQINTIVPEKVTVSMPSNAQTERNFTWHIDKAGYNSDVQIIKAGNSDKNNTSFEDGNVLEFSGSVLAQEFTSYVHQAKATNLEKGTKYYYRVGDKSKNCWSNTGEFITDDGDDNFKFIYFADQQTSASQAPISTYTIQHAKNTVKNSEFILNAGDLINEPLNKEEWKANLNFTAYGDITNIVTTGNHEYYNWNGYHYHSLRNHFYYDFPEQNTETGIYYSLNYGNAHITVLNTNREFYSAMDEEQLEWLKNDLASEAAQNAKFRIVLTHRGPYTTGPHYYSHKDILPLTEQLTSIMANYGVDLVFQGHDHVYSLTYPIDANGQAQSVVYSDVYSNQINSNVKAMTNNTAPVYFIGDAVGPKHEPQLIKNGDSYSIDTTLGKYYRINLDTATIDTYFSKFQLRETPKDENNMRYGIFSSVEINGGNLIVNSYTVDNQNYGDVKLYKSFAISKS